MDSTGKDIIKALLMEYAPVEVLAEYLQNGSLPEREEQRCQSTETESR